MHAAFGVAAHRIDHQRAVAPRTPSAKNRTGADSEPAAVAETPMLDIARINQQSLRLLHLALLSGLAVALYWLRVWAGPADGGVLPRQHHPVRVRQRRWRDRRRGADQSRRPARRAGGRGDRLHARHQPAGPALEVLVLSRLQLAQGSAYAITTLLSYVIVGVGIASTLGTLGVSWDELQWLVAALSVGLGFGLQEIFRQLRLRSDHPVPERPLRIGDVVIGNVSGTVSRIRSAPPRSPTSTARDDRANKVHHRPAHQLVADRHGDAGDDPSSAYSRRRPGDDAAPVARDRGRKRAR